jgi:hypothetical protein
VYQLLELTPAVQNSTFNPGQPNPVITLGYPEQRTFINGGVDGGAGYRRVIISMVGST